MTGGAAPTKRACRRCKLGHVTSLTISMAPLRLALVALLLVAACGASPSSPASRTTPDTPPPAGGGAWTKLRVAWDYGPCPDDGRSCHQTLSVDANGGFVAAETPNAAGSGGSGEPVRRFAALSPQEIRELHRIVDAPGFLEQVGSFGCSPAPDASVSLEVDGPFGTRKDAIGGCVHSADAQSSPPRALVELLEHHRWASGDAQNAHPHPPNGEGDSCTTDTGCAAGLVCVVAPCVVAPCTSGTCHATGP
jgi:hypothetical protein